MQFPFFYEENLSSEDELLLSEETSRHVVQVLRMKEGDQIKLTNGKGYTKTVSIISANKKLARVIVNNTVFSERSSSGISIAISLIKSVSRFEWFLEKATEMGISGIVPFISIRTEKQHIKYQRMKSILISGMLQSQQSWLPEITEPVAFKDVLQNFSYKNRYIAHCMAGEKRELDEEALEKGKTLVLIGPEGDFTGEEVAIAIENNFISVSLGKTRLRTETAAIVAAVLLLYKRCK